MEKTIADSWNNRRLAGVSDKELIKKNGVSKGTFYRYKKILQGKGLI